MDALKCDDCNMKFKTPSQLTKHKEKFCIGGSLGDPNLLGVQPTNRGYTPEYSDRGFTPLDEGLAGGRLDSTKLNGHKRTQDSTHAVNRGGLDH